MTSQPVVQSFYRYNIDPRLLDAQSRVFDHLGVPLHQDRDDDNSHAGWLTELMRRDGDDDEVVVIADIDAFPLSHAAYAGMVARAESGAIAGLAQTTNHLDPSKIFAAPMFLALKRGVYRSFGSPDLNAYETGDVAQILTDIAHERGVDVALTYPRFALQPIWPLADRGVYGVGTFYGEHEFFHLYFARLAHTVDLFCEVADGVIAGRHDWGRYLDILAKAPRPDKKANPIVHNIRKLRQKMRAR
ncbi:MAG: hypothetical protein AAGL96_15140 [Pseudomonadota bacterium]